MRRTLLVPALVILALPLGAQSTPMWRLVPEATFGAAGDPASEFSDIRGIEVSKNGNVLVLDFKAQNIRVFSPFGAFIKVIGRNGQGPGEFMQPNGFARAPDGTIWVNDPVSHRFSVRGDDGEYIKDVPSTVTSFEYIWDAWFDESGRLATQIYARVPGTTVNAPEQSMIERRSVTTSRADTLPRIACAPPNTIQASWSGRVAHASIIMGVPYTPSQSVAYSPRDFAWCAFGRDYTIYRLGLVPRDTQLVIHGAATPVPVTAAERDSAIAAGRAAFERINADISTISPSDIPRVKPVVIGLTLDDQKRLWVRLTSAVKGHTRYDVYDAKGAEIGTIDLAAAIKQDPNVLIRGDKLYGVVLDADDVPAVVRYRIEKVK